MTAAVPAGLVTERATIGRRAAEAAFASLASGPRSRERVVAAMIDAGLARDSARDLLRRAIERGDLLVTERDEKGRPTLALPVGVNL